MTEVVRELRQLEKGTRRGVPTEEQATRLRELRSEQSRLHAALGRLRGELERARAQSEDD